MIITLYNSNNKEAYLTIMGSIKFQGFDKTAEMIEKIYENGDIRIKHYLVKL